MAVKWLAPRMNAEGLLYFDDMAHARQWMYDQQLELFRLDVRTLGARP
jgi:hypothetical protein